MSTDAKTPPKKKAAAKKEAAAKEGPAITVGRTVHYTLSEQDAEHINRRRTSGASIRERSDAGGPWPAGAQAHVGNAAEAGQVLPMLVVRVWDGGLVNGQVFLDGNDTLWVTSAAQGESEERTPAALRAGAGQQERYQPADRHGTWCWPART